MVTYATQGGSTASVAEAIGKTLAENGAIVTVLPIKEVNDLSPYQSVVIGSAIHGSKWMPEALTFIDQHQAAFLQVPTAIFQVCMMIASANVSFKKYIPEWLTEIHNKIQPVKEGTFAGAILPNHYSKITEKIGLRIFLAAIKLKTGDYRDWDAIHHWTEDLCPLLLHQEGS